MQPAPPQPASPHDTSEQGLQSDRLPQPHEPFTVNSRKAHQVSKRASPPAAALRLRSCRGQPADTGAVSCHSHRKRPGHGFAHGGRCVANCAPPTGSAVRVTLQEWHTQTFFGLNGHIRMNAGGEQVSLRLRDLLHMPARTPHAFQLTGNQCGASSSTHRS